MLREANSTGASMDYLVAQGVGDFSAHVCVDLVEHEQRDRVVCGNGRFDREHQA